jgi:Fe-S cluster assembly ATP-binding protein
MKPPLLEIVNLAITVDSRIVVESLNVTVAAGEIVALEGANGSGKSSVAMTLLGDARYKVSKSPDISMPTVLLEGKDLLNMSPDERTKAGLFVAWQSPIAIPGVSVFSFCKAIFEAHGNKISELVAFKNKLEDLCLKVGLPKSYVVRNVNEGFSGGEKKRLELLQLLLLVPKLAILDEIDSGLDSNGIKILLSIMSEMKNQGTSFLLITHNKKLLEDMVVDKTLEMKDGRLSVRI